MEAKELERLYDAHASGLFHYLAGFTKTDGDARDLLQEIFIKLARTDLNEAAWQNERAFIYRLAHNLAIDWLRRSATRHRVMEQLGAEQGGHWHEDLDSDAPFFATHLLAAFAELPAEQRSVAQLKLWEGLTFEEIAAAQGIPLNTAASRYRYALDKLRNMLRPIYGELT